MSKLINQEKLIAYLKKKQSGHASAAKSIKDPLKAKAQIDTARAFEDVIFDIDFGVIDLHTITPTTAGPEEDDLADLIGSPKVVIPSPKELRKIADKAIEKAKKEGPKKSTHKVVELPVKARDKQIGNVVAMYEDSNGFRYRISKVKRGKANAWEIEYKEPTSNKFKHDSFAKNEAEARRLVTGE